MATTTVQPPAASKKTSGAATGFLQALIRGVKPSSKQPKQTQQQQEEENAGNENYSTVLTRAQKRRMSSEAGANAAASAAPAAPALGDRRALNSLSNQVGLGVNNHPVPGKQQQQQQQQKRRGSKRRSEVQPTVVKRMKRSAAASAQEAVEFKLSQESNLGIRNMFAGAAAGGTSFASVGSGSGSSQGCQGPAAAAAADAVVEAKKAAVQLPIELYKKLASQDSVLDSLAATCRYFDHYPYALESFFLDQDLEEAYRRELPLHDFLPPMSHSSEHLPPAMAQQPQLRWDMLRVLIDWLVNAHESLELNYETLYLTVKLIYMYLSRGRVLPKQSLQLLAIAALWIASKKEELFPVQLTQLRYLTLDEYTARQVMAMEQQVLSAIDFRISWPLSYNFLRRYLRVVDHEHQAMSYLSRYLLELSLLDHRLNLERESAKAAAALWLARAQLGMRPLWPDHLAYSTAWRQQDLVPIARTLNALSAQQLARATGALGVAYSGPQSNTYHKYSNAIFKKVALTPALLDDSELLMQQS